MLSLIRPSLGSVYPNAQRCEKMSKWKGANQGETPSKKLISDITTNRCGNNSLRCSNRQTMDLPKSYAYHLDLLYTESSPIVNGWRVFTSERHWRVQSVLFPASIAAVRRHCTGSYIHLMLILPTFPSNKSHESDDSFLKK